MKYVADLDVNGIYWGVLEIEDDALTNMHVEVPQDCDLKGGAYRWTGATFAPLPKAEVFLEPTTPTTDHCLYELLKSQVTIPAYCQQWFAHYEAKLTRGVK